MFPELYRLYDKEIETGEAISSSELRNLVELCNYCALCPCPNIRADIIKAKMDAGETGMAVGKGMYDHDGRDIDAFRQEKLRQFTEMLKMNDALRPPVLED